MEILPTKKVSVARYIRYSKHTGIVLEYQWHNRLSRVVLSSLTSYWELYIHHLKKGLGAGPAKATLCQRDIPWFSSSIKVEKLMHHPSKVIDAPMERP